MSFLSSMFYAATALAAAIVPPSVSAEPITAERFGLYVVTDDLSRSVAFYEGLFGKPQFRVPGMVGFDVAGGLYAVVSRQTFALAVTRGDTTRPYIKATFDHVKSAAPDSLESKSVQVEGALSFFRFRDPDRNVIEFFSVSAAPSKTAPR